MDKAKKFETLINPLYIETFDVEQPLPGAKVTIRKDAGIEWYIVWENCPHKENIIEGWLSSAAAAMKLCTDRQWTVLNQEKKKK